MLGRKIIRHMDEVILKDKIIRNVFRCFPIAYLVGGYLRDLQRGIRSDDLDFLVQRDIRNMLPKFLEIFPGTVVEFKKASTVRVVAAQRTIDFTVLKKSLREDLLERDFTMNAVAWSPEQGIIDPLHGISDMQVKRIRAIAEANFIRDPLRMLRAYRFHAELGWKIDPATRKMIKNLNTKIVESASERITLELFRLLNHEKYLTALRQALQDGLLQKLFFNKNNLLLGNIKALSRFDSFLKKIHDRFNLHFEDTVSQGLSYAGLLRFEQLSAGCDIGMSRLKLSGLVVKRLSATSRLLAKLKKKKGLSLSELFDHFMEAPGAAQDSAILTRNLRTVAYAGKFLTMRPLLPAEKILDLTGLTPGYALGRLMNEMKKMQFLGILKSQEDAMEFLIERRKAAKYPK